MVVTHLIHIEGLAFLFAAAVIALQHAGFAARNQQHIILLEADTLWNGASWEPLLQCNGSPFHSIQGHTAVVTRRCKPAPIGRKASPMHVFEVGIGNFTFYRGPLKDN